MGYISDVVNSNEPFDIISRQLDNNDHNTIIMMKQIATSPPPTNSAINLLIPSEKQKLTLIIIGVYIIAILILWNIPYLKLILYPFKLVTVAFHELSHAAVGICTGAKIISIEVDPDEGGVTKMVILFFLFCFKFIIDLNSVVVINIVLCRRVKLINILKPFNLFIIFYDCFRLSWKFIHWCINGIYRVQCIGI